MKEKKIKDPPKLPEMSGVNLLGRICLHASKSSKARTLYRRLSKETDLVTEVTAQPPSFERLKEEKRGRKSCLSDRFSCFLTSHPGDRPWRRAEGELPLWDPRATLANKAAILTAKIASDFCSWYRNLGGDALIDEQTVQRMFDIHFPEPARGATQVQVRELPRHEVPITVLEKLTMLQPSPPPRPPSPRGPPQVAFGRCVPCSPSSHRPPCRAPPLPQPPAGLLDMQPVFENITEFDITRGYCEVLKHKPDAPRPEYLVKQGLVLPAVVSSKKNKPRPVVVKRESVHEPPWDFFK